METQVRNAVSNYWTDKFNSEIADKSTLKYLDKSELKIGVDSPSMALTTLYGCWGEERDYEMPNIDRHLHAAKRPSTDSTIRRPHCAKLARWRTKISSICSPVARLCTTSGRRSSPSWKSVSSPLLGPDEWQINFSDKISITKLIIDCTNFKHLFSRQSDIDRITRVSTDLCHKLHIKRTLLLQ